MFGWSSYIGKAISAKNFYSLCFSWNIAEVLMILAALNNPPYFIFILHTEPYAPLPTSLMKM